MSGYWSAVLTPVVIDAIAVLGLYVIANTGRLSIGQAAFFGLGGYASAILTVSIGLHPMLSIPLAGIVSGLIGAVFALVARRLSHWFFAITTLAFSVMAIGLVSNSGLLGGATGFYGVPLAVDLPQALIFLVLVVALVAWIDSTAFGRSMRAVRDSDIAAEALGINPTVIRISAFAIGTALAGVAGGLWAHYLGLIRPHDMSLDHSLLILIFLAVGGIEFWAGALFGAFFLGLLPELLRFSNEYRLALFGGLLAFVMVLRPAGILPSSQELVGFAKWCLGRSKTKLEAHDSEGH